MHNSPDANEYLAKATLLLLLRLTKGGARARAVLFKALADRCGLAAGLSLGRCVAGAHAHHAWAVVASAGELAVRDI